ncbi:CUE domain-containing protein [Colletotrichum karsti]|uniref:CUE domain-containing protein n=1 Tax=Colletotrichum karsti TaxID=1095194 RepID=A0A9P6HUZ7_9PEZI|nr:CUE domain-containing protein [Colletotrichum karsti]KAF9871278.1 CUE domain-containing protein [Colletotrichum karsti]
MATIPPVAPFPSAAWRAHLTPQDWNTLIEAWTTLSQAYLALSDSQLAKAVTKDESLPNFLSTFVIEVAETGPSETIGSSHQAKTLLRTTFTLTSRLLTTPSAPPPIPLTTPPFLSGFSKLFRKNALATLSKAWKEHPTSLETSLAGLKKSLTQSLEAGLKADLKSLESRLSKLNHLLHASPDASAFFIAGSDFLDGLVSGFKITNPPLRKVLVATTYVCLIGLTDGESPRFGMLADVLFSLKSAAETHKAGPLNVNDSLVAELVTVTPVLKQLLKRAEEKGAASTALKTRISALEGFKKPGGGFMRPKRLVKRKVDKGKGVADAGDVQAELHIHRQSQIALIQDLFPDLGSGFISKLFDEYGDNTEVVTSHLLEDSLPPHLSGLNRSEQLSPKIERRFSHDIAPRPTPPQLPERHNVFDDDELDRLELDVSKLHFGKKSPEKTADDILKDRSTAPNKAAILSALAAFDSDDDERDDTYDADDVGGTVDNAANEEADGHQDASEETLFKAFQSDPSLFDRQATTRRGQARGKLREETGMTDEAIEGWAVMLGRNPAQKRRLEAKYSGAAAFTGAQNELLSTAWRASPGGSGAEESEPDGGSSSSRGGRGGGRGRGGRGGRGRGGRGGNVAGPTGEKETEAARRRKEANKGSRANHNRRDQRARKMARGGLPG